MPVRVWERLLGEGERGLGQEACCRMAGEEKFGYFHLGEGTEGEDGSLGGDVVGWRSCVCGVLDFSRER